MSIRNTQAKYGAKIPTARSTGAKRVSPHPPDAAHEATTQPASHIEPSKHSTAQVDGFLDMVEENIENTPGSGSPAIKPSPDVDDGGKAPPPTRHRDRT